VITTEVGWKEVGMVEDLPAAVLWRHTSRATFVCIKGDGFLPKLLTYVLKWWDYLGFVCRVIRHRELEMLSVVTVPRWPRSLAELAAAVNGNS